LTTCSSLRSEIKISSAAHMLQERFIKFLLFIKYSNSMTLVALSNFACSNFVSRSVGRCLQPRLLQFPLQFPSNFLVCCHKEICDGPE
jgi:hypothetical protein